MTVYLGKNPVGVGRIVEKKVAKTKFGCSVDNFIGDVDTDGEYVEPSGTFEVNLDGVKSIYLSSLNSRFFSNKGIKKFIANDLVKINSSCFADFAYSASNLEEVHIDSLEIVDEMAVFSNAFSYCYNLKTATFAKLKKVAGVRAFEYCFRGLFLNAEEVFPALEEISENLAFQNVFNFTANSVITLPKVKKITGATASYNSTFGSFYVQNTVWNFPSATEFTGYIWNVGASYAGEIHFAAANREAIEACDGYANKWGFAGASLFFDL